MYSNTKTPPNLYLHVHFHPYPLQPGHISLWGEISPEQAIRTVPKKTLKPKEDIKKKLLKKSQRMVDRQAKGTPQTNQAKQSSAKNTKTT